MIHVTVNGSPQAMPGPVSVGALLKKLDLSCDGIAVAVNAEVVPEGDHEKIFLQEGDAVEIVRAVGGG